MKNLSEKDINQIIEMGKQKIDRNVIASQFDISSRVVRAIHKKNNVEYRKKYDEEMLLKETKRLAKEGVSILQIATQLEASQTKIRSIIKNNNLTITKSKKNSMGKKVKIDEDKFIELFNSKSYSIQDISYIMDISPSTVTKKARSLNLPSKTASEYITMGDKSILPVLYKTLSIQEICKLRRQSEFTIKHKLWLLNLSTEVPISPRRKEMPNDMDFIKDYINPYISHASMESKYNIKAQKIGSWRRKDFGPMFLATKTICFNYNTSYEKNTQMILDKLDIAFNQQKQIGKYKVDFYLGNKKVIECNGSYYHNDNKDNAKRKYLKSNGYDVLILNDLDCTNLDTLEEKITNFIK